MTSLIRSTRLAAELRLLSSAGERRESEQVEIAEPAMTAPKAYTAPPVVTYEEYKQRFAADLTELREQVVEAGREEGLKQGRDLAGSEVRELVDSLRQLIHSIQDARQGDLEKLQDDVAEIVLAAVGKILGEGTARRDMAVAAVRESIRQCRQQESLVIRVAPVDYQQLAAYRAEFLDGVRDVELVADAQVKWGGCIVEGNAGSLDSRLETQLHRLRDTLLNANAHGSGADD